MLCIANMLIYGLKVNISTALIGMVKRRNQSESGNFTIQCPAYSNSTLGDEETDIDGPYDWTSPQQQMIVSYYFIGYFIGNFPFAYFADR